MEEGKKSRDIPDQEAFRKALSSRFPREKAKKLEESTVGIAGLGGLGSHIAVMLARSFVGHLILADYDRVDLTNLNRQAYGISHLGKKKTEAIREILEEINPYLEIRTVDTKVTAENAAALFAGCDVVCEAFDRPEEKAMLVNSLLGALPETFLVSGSGMAGYGSTGLMTVKRPMSRLYVAGDGTSDIETGMCLMAPRVMTCAGMEANMAVRLLLGETEP